MPLLGVQASHGPSSAEQQPWTLACAAGWYATPAFPDRAAAAAQQGCGDYCQLLLLGASLVVDGHPEHGLSVGILSLCVRCSWTSDSWQPLPRAIVAGSA